MSHDLNDTLIFVKVVEAGSFTAAAIHLKLPKTTVSRKVRELEERLGARLLNRTTRRLALTQAGTLYFEHCRRIVEHLHHAEEAVQHLEGSPRGWLRVTASYSFGVNVLAPLLTDFQAHYPDVRLDIVLSNDLLDLVADDIDVALRFGPLPNSSLVARTLANYPCRVYASKSYLAEHGEPLRPEDLRHHRALTYNRYFRGQGYSWPLTKGQRQESFEIQPLIVANDPSILLSMLYEGQGLMLAADPLVSCCPRSTESIRSVLNGWTGPDCQLNAVFMGGRTLSPKVRVFIDFMAERISSLCLKKPTYASEVERRSVGHLELEEFAEAME